MRLFSRDHEVVDRVAVGLIQTEPCGNIQTVLKLQGRLAIEGVLRSGPDGIPMARIRAFDRPPG